MKFYLFLICSVLLIYSTPALAQTLDAAQNTAAWQVVKYDIAATLPTNPTGRNLNAKAVVTLRNVGRAAGSTATLRINQKAEIINTKIGAAEATFRKGTEDRLGNLQRFTINLPAPVQPTETLTVSVEYRLPVVENNGLTAISQLGAQFLPLAVWYPTPNSPYSSRGADFAPFRLTVATNTDFKNGGQVVSSGDFVSHNVGNFEQNLNAQPFFVIGNWSLLARNGTRPIQVFLPQGVGDDERKRAEELMNLADAARGFVENSLGTIAEFPSSKPIRLVAVKRGAGFSDGGTVLIDEAAFRRPKLDASTAMTIAEAVVKVWLGNANLVRGEGFGTIREGLTRYLAAQFIEKQFGKDAADIERLRQRTAYAAIAQREAPLIQTSPSDDTYFAVSANKGAMFWRLIARTIGEDSFFAIVRAQLNAKRPDGLTLTNLRQALTSQNENVKTLFESGFDKTIDLDLLVGLPQTRGSQTAVALRNVGSLPVNVSVAALTDKNERLNATTAIAEKSFGEVVFNTTSKIVRVEVDPEKFYPQLDYSNDAAPREFTENDLQAAISRAFNKQDFAKAEATARRVLQTQPRFDDARTWLGRALLEQNKLDEAEKEFQAALTEKLPTARTQAWANIGLGEIAVKRSQHAQAVKFFDNAVRADAEYGSNLAARLERIRAENAANSPAPIDGAAKDFFTNFDKAVMTKRKAEVESLLVPGELAKFAGGIAGGQPEQWQTKVLRTERLDAEHQAVEVSLNVKLLSRDAQSGTALFTLAKTPTGLKLTGVDLFEVR